MNAICHSVKIDGVLFYLEVVGTSTLHALIKII